VRIRALPSRRTLAILAVAASCLLLALVAGVRVASASWAALAGSLALGGVAVLDYALTRRAWRTAAPRMLRRLPDALAIGLRREIGVALEAQGGERWQCVLYDYVDPTLSIEGLPLRIAVSPGQRTEVSYFVTPTRRGAITFDAADVRVRSRLGLCELRERLGEAQHRRVFPDFAQVARYAWLAGDRRLPELGIKSYQRRGEGTDFRELSEYRIGDSVRHIDWKATLRYGKPIVREFQDDRDQYVVLLVDCGRRMRAEDSAAIGHAGAGGKETSGSHFDHVLNATMLLAYVALRQGDAVGALTFGTPPGQERAVPPHKGVNALNLLMGELYDVQPTPTHSDYIAAAMALLRHQAKRALVIVLTNFRDEDSSELGKALQLLRSRHLVLLASLRERITGDLAAQPLHDSNAAVEVASAHLYEQARRDAFQRLAARDALMVDAIPERLGIELVNRYHAAKRAGLI
jgi:uncharacterized protein (DUF58 family)